MANIKINLNNVPNFFTKMRVYRSASVTGLFDEANFLQEVPIAASYVDTASRSGAVQIYHYGFRLMTDGGVIQEVGPYSVRNVYDLDYLHCYDLPHPFKFGDSMVGAYHVDPNNEFYPNNAEVFALLKSKFPAFTQAYPTEQKHVVSLNGVLYVFGSPYAQWSTTETNFLNFVVSHRKSNIEKPQDSTWFITKNSVKWEVVLLTVDQFPIFGKFVNGCNLPNSVFTPLGITISNNSPGFAVNGVDSQYGFWGGGVAGGGTGLFVTSLTTGGSSTYSFFPYFVLKYAGRV